MGDATYDRGASVGILGQRMTWGLVRAGRAATEAAVEARLRVAAERHEAVCAQYERLLNEATDRVCALEKQVDEQIRRADLLMDRLLEMTGARGVSLQRDREIQRQREEARGLRETLEFDAFDELPNADKTLLVDPDAREPEIH